MVSIRRTTIQQPFTLKGGYQHCPSNAPQTLGSRHIFDRATFGHAQYSLHSSSQHFYSSLLPSNCRLRIAQPYTGFRSSISIPNCALQHAQLCTVSLDFLLVPCYSFPFLPCAPQHSAVQRSL